MIRARRRISWSIKALIVHKALGNSVGDLRKAVEEVLAKHGKPSFNPEWGLELPLPKNAIVHPAGSQLRPGTLAVHMGPLETLHDLQLYSVTEKTDEYVELEQKGKLFGA